MESLRNIFHIFLLSFLLVSFKNVLCKSIFEMTIGESQISNALKLGQSRIKGFRLGQSINNASYFQKRNDLLHAEQERRVGGKLVLNKWEEKVNTQLLIFKQKEVDSAHYGNETFGPQINFLKSRHLYEQSEIFQIIKRMPKGGVLHVHDVTLLSIKKLVSDVTYRPNCYMCYDKTGAINFHFFLNPPANPDCPWKKVCDLREKSGNASSFDKMLVESMSLLPTDTDLDINTIWLKFETILMRATGLITYAPVFRDYFFMALEEFYSDNVQYIEVRALLRQVYNLDGTVLDPSDVVQLYINATESFKQTHPDFSGARIIKTDIRFKTPEEVLVDIKVSTELLQMFPKYFAGYDLVGQEDPLHPLIYYLEPLLWPSRQNPPIHLPYFFHAGETDWEGTRVDDNLLDAILLNTSRIGHGYALTKHPKLLQIVKDRKICVEINPISNQVLKLVDNIQNHPGASLFAQDAPVVISSDDNSVWGAIGLSYDFYAAFMAMTGEDDGLRVLKQLAMNSLQYSSMDDASKSEALKSWQLKWDKFIQNELRI